MYNLKILTTKRFMVYYRKTTHIILCTTDAMSIIYIYMFTLNK